METCPYCATSLPANSQTCPKCGAALVSLQLAVGTRLLEKYQLEKVLGQGGFGITYLAKHTSLGRQVAIKELFPDGCTRRGQNLIPSQNNFVETKQRFLKEARTLAHFNRASIVKVFEVFEANNTAYIVMEALNGETLGTVIAKMGRLPENYVQRIAQDVCAALEVVHNAGLLHRDIKPDNLYITNDNRTVLIDFGSARGFQTGIASRHTQLVSPGYAAPEQYASQAKFGAYTDIYGLSATLFHALTGQVPPTASDRIVSSRIELKFPSDVSENLQNALTRGLALRIDERPQNITAFIKELNFARVEFNTIVLEERLSKVPPDPNLLFEGGTLRVTKTRIHVFKPNQSSRFIDMSSVQDVTVTNDAYAALNVYSMAFGYLGVSMLLVIGCVASIVFIQEQILSRVIFFVGLALIVFITFSWFRKDAKISRNDIYYLLVKQKPFIAYDFVEVQGKTTVILENQNQQLVNHLADQIRKLLTP